MPTILAHRGASAYAPQNTMAAFRLAKRMRADAIEIDIHMTADQRLVVIHNDEIDEVSNGRGKVRDLTLEQLKQFDFGSYMDRRFRGEKIPELREVLQFVKDNNMQINIEIKHGDEAYPGMEAALAEELRRYGMLEDTVVSSFNTMSLRRIKSRCPTLKCAQLCLQANPEEVLKNCFDGVHPYFLSLTKEVVRACHSRGLFVNTWTVEEPETISTLLSWDVDGIITNKPDVAKKCVEAKTGK